MRSLLHLPAAVVLLAGPAASSFSHAGTEPTGWRYSVAAAPAWIAEVDLDEGGRTSLSSSHFRAGAERRLKPDLSVGVKAHFDLYDRDFSGSQGFAALQPWDETSHFGVTGAISKRTGYGWSYGIRPFISWASESGDLDTDALSYGVGFAALAGLSAERRAGLGARVTREIDDSFGFSPVLIVDWKFNDHWSLANPREPSFTVPAGLEIRYRHDERWQFALAGVYQSSEFRLDESTLAPGGIGEASGFLSFLRLSRQLNPQLSINGYAGAMFGGKLQVDNAQGDEIASSKFDTAPLAALSVEGNF